MNGRYEVFMDEVKPQDLSVAFLREFMSLPNSYFKPGAAATYRKSNTENILNHLDVQPQ